MNDHINCEKLLEIVKSQLIATDYSTSLFLRVCQKVCAGSWCSASLGWTLFIVICSPLVPADTYLQITNKQRQRHSDLLIILVPVIENLTW